MPKDAQLPSFPLRWTDTLPRAIVVAYFNILISHTLPGDRESSFFAKIGNMRPRNNCNVTSCLLLSLLWRLMINKVSTFPIISFYIGFLRDSKQQRIGIFYQPEILQFAFIFQRRVQTTRFWSFYHPCKWRGQFELKPILNHKWPSCLILVSVALLGVDSLYTSDTGPYKWRVTKSPNDLYEYQIPSPR